MRRAFQSCFDQIVLSSNIKISNIKVPTFEFNLILKSDDTVENNLKSQIYIPKCRNTTIIGGSFNSDLLCSRFGDSEFIFWGPSPSERTDKIHMSTTHIFFCGRKRTWEKMINRFWKRFDSIANLLSFVLHSQRFSSLPAGLQKQYKSMLVSRQNSFSPTMQRQHITDRRRKCFITLLFYIIDW